MSRYGRPWISPEGRSDLEGADEVIGGSCDGARAPRANQTQPSCIPSHLGGKILRAVVGCGSTTPHPRRSPRLYLSPFSPLPLFPPSDPRSLFSRWLVALQPHLHTLLPPNHSPPLSVSVLHFLLPGQ